MDVRETTELDEDERIITIVDGSDTGIVNNQVPEADIIRYKDSTYEIVSKIAYLIGVPKRIFENEHEPPKTEVYERLEQDKAARIIRHLCIIRTAIERNFKHINEKMRFDYTSIYNLPEYIPPDSMTQLSADGVNFVRKSSKKLCHHVIEINKLIADRINNCKKLFPLWLNWQYVKNLFVMPNGLTEDGTKAAADIYYSHLLFYPYQVYINWTPKEEGNILYNDKKFVTLLYQWNNDYFTEYSKVSDAGSYVKGSIYEFIESSEKVVIVVDCENSDPYKLCATLRNLDRQYTKKISSIILFDDVHAASAWRILESFTAIPVEHMMIERESCGPDLKNALSDAGIFYCYIDDFYSGNTEDIKQGALFKEMYRYIDNAVRLNIFEMFDEAIRTTRIEMSSAEKQQFISQYVKTMQMRITDSGDVVLEFKRK